VTASAFSTAFILVSSSIQFNVFNLASNAVPYIIFKQQEEEEEEREREIRNFYVDDGCIIRKREREREKLEICILAMVALFAYVYR
jgi:hypothetical protein